MKKKTSKSADKVVDDVSRPNKTIGAPSTYKEEYCQALIEHQAKGYSYESFAATIGGHRDTLYGWEEVHPKWLEAKKIAKDQRRLFFEKAGIDGIYKGNGPNGSYSIIEPIVWIFSMKAFCGVDENGSGDEPGALQLSYSLEDEE